MTTAALMQDLAGRGVTLAAVSGALRFRAPAGVMTPELRRQIETHKTALMQALGAGEQAGLFDKPKPDPRAGRLVHADFERARHRLADLEAELDAGASHLAGLPQPWPGDLVDELNAKARAADKLAAVADFATFDELEEATGRAYVAHCGNPSDPALLNLYRRLDDAWAAVLGLPESQGPALVARADQDLAQDPAPAALGSPDELARTQDEAARRAPSDPARARLAELLQPKPGGLTLAEVGEVRGLAQSLGVAVRFEKWDPADPAAGWQEIGGEL